MDACNGSNRGWGIGKSTPFLPLFAHNHDISFSALNTTDRSGAAGAGCWGVGALWGGVVVPAQQRCAASALRRHVTAHAPVMFWLALQLVDNEQI